MPTPTLQPYAPQPAAVAYMQPAAAAQPYVRVPSETAGQVQVDNYGRQSQP